MPALGTDGSPASGPGVTARSSEIAIAALPGPQCDNRRFVDALPWMTRSGGQRNDITQAHDLIEGFHLTRSSPTTA
jgi:hypothetical protein